ncbi:MAG: TrkH family potassium uptake protein [Alphaproteobacteria bacterium]|nr:TrkH family potassium uptake protein [Alphaproteobacteria bacterium]
MWQPVLMINGFIIFVLGLMMFVPSFVLYYYTGTPDYNFIQGGITAIFLGGLMFLANFGKVERISVLQGYLITVFCWFLMPFVCALPLLNNGGFVNFVDALFEATSGITATGATVLQNIEAEPRSVLFWRAMLNGLGGIGIVIFAVALMPFLRIGGMHLFNKENSDTEEKFLPKVQDIAKDIIIMYLILNMLCAFLLNLSGMNKFDAICFAMSTLGTGGLSPKNTSVAFFDSAVIELVIGIFMTIGALPITYFILIFKKKTFDAVISNTQVNTFLKLLCFYILGFSIFYSLNSDIGFIKAMRYVSFNTISAITTTGLTSTNFLAWGNWAIIVFLIFYFHGGCTGSTTGSVKIFRWQVITSFFKKNAIKSLSPNQVAVMKIGNKIIDDSIVSSVFVLVFGFIGAIILFSLIICLTGVDFLTSIGAVSACITNSGIGLTELTGPSGNFSHFSDFVKYILSFAMVLGRLEVVVIWVLFTKIKLP